MTTSPIHNNPLSSQQSNIYSNSSMNTSNVSFSEALSKATAERSQGVPEANAERALEYIKHLESKYGTVTIRDVGKDQLSLERIGKGMSGRDVVIATNIFIQMASDPERAAYYEGQIDSVFNKIPEYTAQFAAQGLTFQSCGVVVHEDGTITHISGSSDSPERVRQVEEENRAKREKRAELLDELMQRIQETTENQRQLAGHYHLKQSTASVTTGRNSKETVA